MKVAYFFVRLSFAFLGSESVASARTHAHVLCQSSSCAFSVGLKMHVGAHVRAHAGMPTKMAPRRPKTKNESTRAHVHAHPGMLSFFVWGHIGAQDGPRWPKMAPRWPQDGPSWPQDGPKMAQDGPKMAPRWPKMDPRWPKMALRWPKMDPRWPKMAPRWPNMGPTWAQDGSKMAPRWPPSGLTAQAQARRNGRSPLNKLSNQNRCPAA